MNDDVFARMAQAKDELAQPSFAAHAGTLSPTSRQLALERELGGDQYDAHLAHGTKTRHHDQSSFENKVQTGQGGDGGPPWWWPPGQRWPGGSGGSGGGGGNGGGGHGGNGGGGKWKGPPGWFTRWKQHQGQRGGGARGGGGGLAGPGAIGKIPQLGKVPIASPASSPATSPIPIVLVFSALAIGGYLLWHKLRLAKHQDAQLDSGKKPDADAAA